MNSKHQQSYISYKLSKEGIAKQLNTTLVNLALIDCNEIRDRLTAYLKANGITPKRNIAELVTQVEMTRSKNMMADPVKAAEQYDSFVGDSSGAVITAARPGLEIIQQAANTDDGRQVKPLNVVADPLAPDKKNTIIQSIAQGALDVIDSISPETLNTPVKDFNIGDFIDNILGGVGTSISKATIKANMKYIVCFSFVFFAIVYIISRSNK